VDALPRSGKRPPLRGAGDGAGDGAWAGAEVGSVCASDWLAAAAPRMAAATKCSTTDRGLFRNIFWHLPESKGQANTDWQKTERVKLSPYTQRIARQLNGQQQNYTDSVGVLFVTANNSAMRAEAVARFPADCAISLAATWQCTSRSSRVTAGGSTSRQTLSASGQRG
jgi:hypothetical protein